MRFFLDSDFFTGVMRLLFGLGFGVECGSSSVPIGAYGSASVPIGANGSASVPIGSS
jgi:hypothetical protein